MSRESSVCEFLDFQPFEEDTMSFKLSAAALAVALVVSMPAFAGAPSTAAFDPDKDGTIDLAEAQAAGAKLFATLDPDKDGTLDAKELEGRIDAAGLKTADPDSDGTLDAKEFASVIEARFKTANPDNDGTIDDKELGSKEGAALLELMQ